MRLPTKTGYAIRALFHMAFYGRGERVQAKEIAERQRIPLRYLEEVLQDLRRAGLVMASRGPRGGYLLARLPETISVGDIMRALGGLAGDWFDAEPSVDDAEPTPRALPLPPGEVDVPALLGRDLARRMEAALDAVSLRDYLQRAEAEGLEASGANLMYFI
jgi:Rrf2 family protein